MITKDTVTPSMEASDLGWKPGVWPPAFRYNGTNWYKGKALWASDHEFTGYIYENSYGDIMKVWND